ncbi:copper chaperone PCu(A)C [Xenophilus sp.]|jgi:copper(I)-binding protein|uniref:copper chaperone PCu(A)C n=1 Tax=Xenophilus sp. TaxID=1873499 RepID=UPI0037DD2E9E
MTFLSSTTLRSAAALVLLAGAAAAFAQPAAPVQADGAWVRATVPGQSGTGAFMTLTAQAPLKLVGVSTPAAEVAEVHEMKMEGDTMRMRGIPSLALPAHQAVELKPGGYHVMLMDLAQPLKAGATVPLTLRFEDAQGAKSTLSLQVPVRAAAPAGGAAQQHRH